MELRRQFLSVVPLFGPCHAALMRFFETVVIFAIAEAAVVRIITKSSDGVEFTSQTLFKVIAPFWQPWNEVHTNGLTSAAPFCGFTFLMCIDYEPEPD